MKKLLSLLLVPALLAGCSKDKVSTDPGTDNISNQSTKVYTGNFVNGPYGNASGKAHVVKNADNSYELFLEGVSISNGPDLHVYLSKELQPVNFINLGKLKSVSGNQVYAISQSVDYSQYTYALVHCKAFNHMFGSALLVKN